MSMSQFATFAEYEASIKPIDKAAVLTNISAMAAEVQRDKDAARYVWLRDHATEGEMYSFSMYQGAVLDTAIDQEIARNK